MKPPRLKANPIVQVVFPSGSCLEHQSAFLDGVRLLEKYGCIVRYDSSRASEAWRGYLSGPDSIREDELLSALRNPEIDIVWFGRGGSGCNRIHPHVIQKARTLTPKTVIGFSDATSLLNGLAQHLGWTCFHGPVITTLGRTDPASCVVDILARLRGERERVRLDATLQDMQLEGRLLGGNLTVLASMIGTSYAPQAEKNAIWMLEDVGEAPYRIDRCFRQLVDAGIFEDASGIWLGDFDLNQDDEARIKAVITQDAPCAVYDGAPAGHRGPLSLLPIGALIQIADGYLTAQWVES